MQLSSNKLPEKLICPRSKSYAARALILGALKKDSIKLKHLPLAQDTLDLLNVLKSIGLDIKENQDELIITNSFPQCETSEEIFLDGGEGGTTVRFLLPFLALGKTKYHIRLKGNLASRPMDEILMPLKAGGVGIEQVENSIIIQGPFEIPNSMEIDCEKSSQFISAFEHLRINHDFELKAKNLNSSQSYYEMSQFLVKHFKECTEYEIPLDYSSLGYFLVYGCLTNSIEVPGIEKIDWLQADAQIFNVFDQLNIDYSFKENKLRVEKIKSLDISFNIDGSKCIDLVPSLIFLAANLIGESNIKNIKTLKFKECDRLDQMFKIMKQFKVVFDYDEKADELKIKGQNTQIDCPSLCVEADHRMIMVGAMFLKYHGGGSITPWENVNKSFPDFFNFFT